MVFANVFFYSYLCGPQITARKTEIIIKTIVMAYSNKKKRYYASPLVELVVLEMEQSIADASGNDALQDMPVIVLTDEL